jgi:Protein of unknown function (DUF2397)
MRGLQRTVDLHGISVEAFLAYKEKLVDYLERFIGELVVASNRAAEAVLGLESSSMLNFFAGPEFDVEVGFCAPERTANCRTGGGGGGYRPILEFQ